MAGIYGLHYFMFWCVVVASGSSGQSDGGICGGVSHIEALQAQLAKAEQDATASCPVLVPQLQSIASQLQLLNTNLTELGECDKITCPEGYVMPCGDMCYRLYNGTGCRTDDGRWPVPMSQNHITCLLDLTSDTNLPVATAYFNVNGVSFTSWYDGSVAPAELIDSARGPGGDIDRYGDYAESYAIIDRKSGKLVRSKDLTLANEGSRGWVIVCEKPPVE